MPTRTRHLPRQWSRMLAADGTFTDLTPTNDEAQANDSNDDGTIVGEAQEPRAPSTAPSSDRPVDRSRSWGRSAGPSRVPTP